MSMAYESTHDAQCAHKRTYLNSHDAKKALRHTQASIGGHAMCVYHCPWCSTPETTRWHIGRPNPIAIERARRVA